MTDVDPRELTAGYAFAVRNLGSAWGVLRDGRTEVWRCQVLPAHRVHPVPGQAQQCAQRELERRRQGASEVLWAGYCEPCGAFWDLGGPAAAITAGPDLLRGRCPRCQVPYARAKIAVLERQEAGVR
jgi:hypothetical protein